MVLTDRHHSGTGGTVFDISEGSGIAGAINGIYDAFSQLGVTPNDNTARQNVISRAQDIARNFNFTATSLIQMEGNTKHEIRGVVEEVNRIATSIRDLNVELRQDYRKRADAGVDARINATLEELAELVGFNALRQDDGSITVLLGGQVPIVIGDKTFAISEDFSGSQVNILNFEGTSITSVLQEGKLGGLLEMSNTLLPSYLGILTS